MDSSNIAYGKTGPRTDKIHSMRKLRTEDESRYVVAELPTFLFKSMIPHPFAQGKDRAGIGRVKDLTGVI